MVLRFPPVVFCDFLKRIFVPASQLGRRSFTTSSPVLHGALLRFNWSLATAFKYIG